MTAIDIKKILGQRIRVLRKRQGLTQEEMAERCRLHWTYIGGLERGERNPTLTTLNRVAQGLNVGLNALVNPRSFPSHGQPDESSEGRILRLLRKQGKDGMDLAAGIVREVAHWRERYGSRKG